MNYESTVVGNIYKIMSWVYIKTERLIEGFRAKRAYIAFWADFHFLQDQATFWQIDLFWHEKHLSKIVFVDLHLFFTKAFNQMKSAWFDSAARSSFSRFSSSSSSSFLWVQAKKRAMFTDKMVEIAPMQLPCLKRLSLILSWQIFWREPLLLFFYWHEALRAEKRKLLVKTVGILIFMPSAFDRCFWLGDIF